MSPQLVERIDQVMYDFPELAGDPPRVSRGTI